MVLPFVQQPWRFVGLLSVVATCLIFEAVLAQPLDDTRLRIAQYLDSGEFSLALQWAQQQPKEKYDESLALIARAQMDGGASYGAYQSASSIGDDDQRSSTLSSLHDRSGQGGASGGITAADFTELMQLIQNVIEPESWDTEGPAMRPYAAGVFVDAHGALKRVQRSALADASQLQTDMIRDSGNRDLNRVAALRKISLTRLERNLQRIAAQGQQPTDSMQYLAGLQRIEFVLFCPETNEIIIAGPAGPMATAADGQRINSDTKQPVLMLDDLVQCLRNAWFEGGRLGCSIDPRQENLAKAQQFLTSTRLSGQNFRNALQESLGWQDIRVHGVEPGSHVAQVLVEADYLMKCIGLGVEQSIAEVPCYWDRLDLKNGPPPAMEVARWWFTMNYDAILANPSTTIFQLRGQGVKVLSENELLAQNGERVHTGQSQGPTREFAADFTKHFASLCQKFPAFGQLRGVFDMALVATIIRRQVEAGKIGWTPHYFCTAPDVDHLRYQVPTIATPKTVMSVVNHRTFDTREGGRHLRHMVVGVGGGVEFDAKELLQSNLRQVAAEGALERAAPDSKSMPVAVEQWWWD